MQKRPPQLKIVHLAEKPKKASVSTAEMPTLLEAWLVDNEVRRLSPTIRNERRRIVSRLIAFVRAKGHEQIGTTDMRAYRRRAQQEAQCIGRKSCAPRHGQDLPRPPLLLHGVSPAGGRPGGVADGKGRKPIVRKDQIDPFEPEHIASMLAAVKFTVSPKRDEAIIKMLSIPACALPSCAPFGWVTSTDRRARCA